MKILILGDSYAENKHDLSWVNLIVQNYNAICTNFSRAASSFYYSFDSMVSQLSVKKYDVVILVITSMDRFYHKDYILHRGYPQKNDGSPVPEIVKTSLESFYTHCYDMSSTYIAKKIAIHALSSVSLQYPNTKFIFISAFENETNLLKTGNCVLTTNRLLDYSMLDKIAHKKEFLGQEVENRFNHLTVYQNKTLAKNITNFIDNFEYGIIQYKKLQGMEIL